MSLDKALSNREQNLSKFCAHLDKDIDKLAEGAKDIQDQAQVCYVYIVPLIWCMYAGLPQNPIILDANSESSKVQDFLGNLLEKLDELQQQAYTYKTYQKNFKVTN